MSIVCQDPIVLRRAPWCWPVDGVDLDEARVVAGLPDAPLLEPGDAPLLGVNSGDGASLLLLRVGRKDPAGLTEKGLPVLWQAEEAWDDALTALPGSLPMLWTSLGPLRGSSRLVLPLRNEATSFAPSGINQVDGKSFGLSFLLAQASYVLGVPLAADVAASARVNADGTLESVDGLANKLELVIRSAPRITRILVSKKDEALARDIVCGRSIRVQGCERASDAIEAAFAQSLEQIFAEAGKDASDQRRLTLGCYEMALYPSQRVLDWTGVTRACTMALARWTAMGDHDRRRLEFARGVAARHMDNSGGLKLDQILFDEEPAVRRPLVLCHWLQSAADTGEPNADEITSFGSAWLKGRPDDSIPTLRVMGALGRLYAVSGKPEEALELNLAAAEGFSQCIGDDLAQISFQLSILYRLTGALNRQDVFARVQQLEMQVADRGVRVEGQSWVDLERSRALVFFDRIADAEPVLEQLGNSQRIESHVKWGAVRILIGALRRTARDAEAANWLACLRAAAAAGQHDAPAARMFELLAQLEAAVLAGDREGSSQTLDELGRLQPGVTGNLTKAAGRAHADPAEYVIRFFPY